MNEVEPKTSRSVLSTFRNQIRLLVGQWGAQQIFECRCNLESICTIYYIQYSKFFWTLDTFKVIAYEILRLRNCEFK